MRNHCPSASIVVAVIAFIVSVPVLSLLIKTQKKWLAAQPPAASIAQLQAQLDRFRRYYNTVRPHRAINRRTPAVAYAARPKAHPSGPRIHPHYRVRRDRTDQLGVVTLRYDSRLRHIGLGREHAHTRVRMLVADLKVRIIDAETGALLRQLVLDPTRDYQPLGRPPGPPPGRRRQQLSAPPADGVKAGRRPPAGPRP
jgi:hypothetical protein